LAKNRIHKLLGDNIHTPQRAAVDGGCRRLHDEELHVRFIKYYQGGQIKKIEMSGPCSTHGSDEACITYFGRKI